MKPTSRRLFLKSSSASISSTIFVGLIASPGKLTADTTDTTDTTEEQTTTPWPVQFKMKTTQQQEFYVCGSYSGISPETAIDNALGGSNGTGVTWVDVGDPVNEVLSADSTETGSISPPDTDGMYVADDTGTNVFFIEGSALRTVITITDFY